MGVEDQLFALVPGAVAQLVLDEPADRVALSYNTSDPLSFEICAATVDERARPGDPRSNRLVAG